MSDTFETSKDVAWLKEMYFSRPGNTLTLKKGDVLLRAGTHNEKLYLILHGTLAGFLEDENGELFEVFKSTRNMFVGVYSYFSPDRSSYLTVVADEPTTVAFLDPEDKQKPEFASHFLPVIVHEIYLRQVLTQQLTRQRQAAIKKLHESEKMATLGHLAAGLAHELNNAVGVLQRNTEWLIESFSRFLSGKKLNSVFESSLEQGIIFSTTQLRERRKVLEDKFGLSTRMAKQLAKTGIGDHEIEKLIKGNTATLEAINLINETGLVLHDMRVAAAHSTHVVQSVKELGFSTDDIRIPTFAHETVAKSLALLKSMLSGIKIEMENEATSQVSAVPGELVQVWVNIIKNACESMRTANTADPEIQIGIQETPHHIKVGITDNGPGIPTSIVEKIFEPSFSTKVKGLSFGLGLGLSIVRKIVADYKGTIDVSSLPGETTFTVTLRKITATS